MAGTWYLFGTTWPVEWFPETEAATVEDLKYGEGERERTGKPERELTLAQAL